MGRARLRGMSTTSRSQRGSARVKRPERNQIEMRCLSLDQLIEPGHRVRTVWQYAQACDLAALYQEIRAVEGGVGRDATDPRLLFALWLFATLEGVASARVLERRCERDLPYQWLCGGVGVNHHLLSDFRVAHGELLKQLLIDSIGVLLHQDLITLETVAQDGMRVRASAGTSSFRRRKSLEQALEQAREQVDKLERERDEDPSGDDRRQRGARERAAKDRQERIEQAQAELEKLHQQRDRRRGTPTSEPRTSTTDPEARRMKMADGGFRPAYNVQFATDADTRLIVGVDVTQQGTDSGHMQPMHQRLGDDYGVTPRKYLVDGGFAKREDVTSLEQAGTQIYAPLIAEDKQRAAGQDPYAKKSGDTPEMAAFRQRMGTAEAKMIYKKRPGVAEFPNADCRNRGLVQFRVRGLKKVHAQTLWHVLAFNFLRLLKLDHLKVILAGS